jgi:hypothetical protein
VDRDDPAGATQKECTRGPGSPQMVERTVHKLSKASEAALAVVLRERPDIVITDLVMLERLPPVDLPDLSIYLII